MATAHSFFTRPMTAQRSTLSMLRQAILCIMVLVVAGTTVELFLLKHTDGPWQLTPLLLLGATAIVLLWYAFARSARALLVLRGVMVVALLSGIVGIVQHFRANVVYASESDPSLSGKALILEALWGSTPALAPGTMIQLALLGLAFTFRHPRLRGVNAEADPSPPKELP